MTPSPGGRRAIDALLPFFIGIVLGITSTFSLLSGRVTKVEADQAADHATIVDLRGEQKEQGRILRNVAVKLGIIQ